MNKKESIFQKVKHFFADPKTKIKIILKTPSGFYIAITVGLIALVTIVDIIFHFCFSVGGNVKNVWLNIHASIVEVFLLGLFITWFNRLTEKKRNIQGWIEEIDDYRGWKEPEAAYRIRGAIKRLNNENISEINLNGCNLEDMDLMQFNLTKADMVESNLSGAIMIQIKLDGAKLMSSKLIGSNLMWASLIEAKAWGADFRKANITDADLSGARLMSSNFGNTTLVSTNLTGADLTKANLTGAILQDANLFNAILLDSTLSHTNLSGAIVDDDWFQKIIRWNCIGLNEIKESYFLAAEEEEGKTVYRLRDRVIQEAKTEE